MFLLVLQDIWQVAAHPRIAARTFAGVGTAACDALRLIVVFLASIGLGVLDGERMQPFVAPHVVLELEGVAHPQPNGREASGILRGCLRAVTMEDEGIGIHVMPVVAELDEHVQLEERTAVDDLDGMPVRCCDYIAYSCHYFRKVTILFRNREPRFYTYSP